MTLTTILLTDKISMPAYRLNSSMTRVTILPPKNELISLQISAKFLAVFSKTHMRFVMYANKTARIHENIFAINGSSFIEISKKA